jgi:hypothetical protein
MSPVLSSKYFYISIIVSALAVIGIFTATNNLFNHVEPSIHSFVDKEYIINSIKFTNEIEQICKQDPEAEFLLVGLVGGNMEIITKIDSYNKWTLGYRDSLTDKIKITLMRGVFQLALSPLPRPNKGKMI